MYLLKDQVRYGRVHYVVLQHSTHSFLAVANLDQLDPLDSSLKVVPMVSILPDNGVRA